MIVYEKGKVVVRDSVPWDVEHFGNMREADKAEIWAEGHYEPDFALRESIRNSLISLTFLNDGKIVAMFGIVPETFLSKKAQVWMLSTDEIYSVKIRFLKISRFIIEKFLKFYPILWNFVDARYAETIRWLEWSGAKVYDPVSYGVDAMPFRFFVFGES